MRTCGLPIAAASAALLLASCSERRITPPRHDPAAFSALVDGYLDQFRGATDLLRHDLPAAFADVSDAALQTALEAAADDARQEIDAYVTELETTILAQSTDAFAIGIANVEARYRAEELIDTPAAALLAIGERELKKAQADFEATAARVDPSRPGRSSTDVWRDVLADHPTIQTEARLWISARAVRGLAPHSASRITISSGVYLFTTTISSSSF